MSRRRRRARSPLLRFALMLWAVVIAAALARSLAHVAGWALLTAAVAAAGYALGRRSGAPGTSARLRSARPSRAALGPSERRSRANGWTAPTRMALVTVSAACAGSECVWCHDPRCEHDCGHPSREPAALRPAELPDKPPF